MRKSLWCIFALSLAALATLAAGPPNLPAALDTQRRLATERPQDPGVFNDLGNLLVLAGKPDEAEAAYRRSLEIDQQRASAHFNLGLLLQQKGDRKEAMKHYREAVEIDPRHAWAHFQIGMLYEGMGQESKAIDAYARAYALNPQLAFPEVNPNLLDSKLVTASMLKAYQEGPPRPLAPTRYDDPQRIAGLLVPRPTPTPDEAEVAEDPAARKTQTGDANAGAMDPAAAGAAPQVLRPTDLNNGGASGQVTPPGAARARPVPGAGAPGQPSRPGLRNWTRPEPIEQPEEGVGNEGEYVIPPPPPSEVIYRPGLPSTGRLDLKVIPGRKATTDRRG